MAMARTANAAHEVAFEAYGVRIAVAAPDSELLWRLVAELPPGSQRCPLGTANQRFAVMADGEAGYRISAEYGVDESCFDQDLAIRNLGSCMNLHIAEHAPAL